MTDCKASFLIFRSLKVRGQPYRSRIPLSEGVPFRDRSKIPKGYIEVSITDTALHISPGGYCSR